MYNITIPISFGDCKSHNNIYLTTFHWFERFIIKAISIVHVFFLALIQLMFISESSFGKLSIASNCLNLYVSFD